MVPGLDRPRLAREVYEAYVSGDRAVVEARLTDDFAFYSPPDPGIDRAAYTRARKPTGAGSATPRC